MKFSFPKPALLKHIAYALFIASISSCTTIYIPNTVHSPLLSEKGDINTQLGTGVMGGTNVQAAYAVNGHLGIMANAMWANKNEVNFDLRGKHREHLYEVAPGYYSNLDGNTLRFECYGGIGLGQVEENIDSDSSGFSEPEVKANYTKLFFQPAIGVKTTYFDASFAFRISNLLFSNVRSDYEELNRRNFNFWTAEPTLTVAAGHKNFKPYLQMGLVVPVSNYPNNESGGTNITFIMPISINIGLRLSINNQ